MKKFIGFLLFFLFVGTVGCRVEHFLITGIYLSPVEYYTSGSGRDAYSSYRTVSEFKDKIIFQVTEESEHQYTADEINLNTGSQCYATSLGYAEDNRLLRETYSMTLDKVFSYAGKRVESGVNILEYPAFLEEIIIIEPEHASDRFHTILFSDTFVQNASFDSEPYTVTFSCRTSDDRFLQTDATVKFPVETNADNEDL